MPNVNPLLFANVKSLPSTLPPLALILTFEIVAAFDCIAVVSAFGAGGPTRRAGAAGVDFAFGVGGGFGCIGGGGGFGAESTISLAETATVRLPIARMVSERASTVPLEVSWVLLEP